MINKPRPPIKPKAPRAPWTPVPYTIADVAAIQALNRGTASPEQQMRALAFIINIAAGTYDEPFYNLNEEGRRDTDFALGKAFVGRQLVKLTKIDLGVLKAKEKASLGEE